MLLVVGLVVENGDTEISIRPFTLFLIFILLKVFAHEPVGAVDPAPVSAGVLLSPKMPVKIAA